MRKVRQLKESLLGWGGYKDVQDKIYLDKQVVYMRGPRVVKNGVTTEKLYLVNMDGTQSDKAFEIRIDPDSTALNEKFFFDKRTQCIVRTAYEETGNKWGSFGPSVSKKIVFDLYDPNTLEHLDHHIVEATSSQYLEIDARKENCSQGLYSFYCNGIGSVATTTDSGREHPATVIVYSPRHKKVFTIPVGDVVDVENPITTGTYITPLRDTYFNIYNKSDDLDKLDNLTLGMLVPHYITDAGGAIDQRFYVFNINLETNPISLTTQEPIIANTNTTGYFQYTNEKYPNFPFTSAMVTFANSNGDMDISVSYNKYADAIPDPAQDILVENKLGYFKTNWTIPTGITAKINPDINMLSGTNCAAFTLQIADDGWRGRGLLYVTRNTNIENGNPFKLHTVSITTSELESPITNSSAYPRMLSAPKKIVEKPIKLSESGEVIKIDDVVYTKSYSDPCIASLVITADFIVPLIISETKYGATGYTSVHSTAGTTWKIKYNNKTYYVCFTDDPQPYSPSPSITNTMNLPKLYVNIGSLAVWDFSTIQQLCTMVLDSYYREGYEVPIFIKDYYNDGTNKLVYKYRWSTNYTKPVVYDSVTGNATETIENELSTIPLSEQHMVLTSTADTSGLARYINLISTAEDEPHLRLTYYTKRLDCNTNTKYLADNTTAVPSLLQDGAFRIPPVAIADGELTPVDDTLPENYYAWKKASDNTIIYTNSLDPSEVVGTAYYFKGTLNDFYQEVLSNISEITSLTNTYLTTRVGVEYTRLSEYDWSLKRDEQVYVPSHLKGWTA